MKYNNYEEVPWLRKEGTSSVMLLIGLFFGPLVWIVCIVCLTGDIYKKNYDQDGNLAVWGVANKVVAVLILVVQSVFYGWWFLSKLS